MITTMSYHIRCFIKKYKATTIAEHLISFNLCLKVILQKREELIWGLADSAHNQENQTLSLKSTWSQKKQCIVQYLVQVNLILKLFKLQSEISLFL